VRPADAPAPSDDELTAAVRSAQGGNEAAFRVVYRATQPMLLRYAIGMVGAEGEDVASEAWLQISRDLGSFDGDYRGFRGWAATILRHRAMDHLRRRQRRPNADAPLDVLFELADPADTAMLAVNEITTRASISLIRELPPDQAEAVLLRVVMGLDVPTTARILGKRPGAVRTAAYRGLRALAARLAQPGQPDAR
jgi:RNA polymerase sigma-70 factor (ECF subfamily)